MKPSTALLALGALPSVSAETVLGLYIFHRHGDRTAKSWPPTSLTALGAGQVFSAGSFYRNRYVAGNATSRIHGLSPDLAVLSQLAVTAPLDTVLQNSALVFLQGLYPPAGAAAEQKLANGTTTEAPFDGYQYIPVNVVSNSASSGGSEDSTWLQGSSGCGKAVVSSNNYFSSQEYLDTLASTGDFYKSLLPVINGTFGEAQATFKNAYAIFDAVHVSTIHNSTLPSPELLTKSNLFQLQTRADQHEWGLAFNESDHIRAISGSVLAAQMLQSLNATLHASPSKASAGRLGIQFGAYAAFMSFFGLAGLPAASPDFRGLVDYASSFAIELVTNATVADDAKEPVNPADVGVRFLFANGSAANAGLTAFPLFGQQETVLPWDRFADEMGRFAIGDTLDWCRACGNTTGNCAAAASGSSGDAGSSTAGGGGGNGITTPVAGVIGALVALVVVLGVEGLVMAIAGLRVVKKGAGARGKTTGA